ncbi:hypothetical protein SERLADRAFT_432587 [Serpula lacrymans var. lacrymans S7.9]|uniref:RAVE complex protein Rav1 C-terminal domain-containing protein n=1 Tax=Serpula lacrymans var. lacrymans (strain S7.9) TaxID=578457 RepID=F8NFV5_SERL9|nr:uncharacterized protein SERLADRAFT_432587 [Serpula lacrymans var. lacrymans S7.9]EGO30925.1 hypothetical protein SERLADRAFT_432587 [Serpula lacrymans var. lacrymans S7.9]
MLDLVRTFTGCPAGPLQHLILPHATLIVYPSAESVVLLHASTLTLVRVLAFEEVFPAIHSRQSVSYLAVDPGMKLIVASMGTRIAVWSLSEVDNKTWRIHSSLIFPEDDNVTTLESRSGLLAVGSQSGLSVFTLILDDGLPTWSKKWSSSAVTPYIAAFAPSLTNIATTAQSERLVRLYSTTSGRQTQSIPHARPVINMKWRYPQASSRDDVALYTITSDSVLRIFLPVIDSPQRLQLHASLDLFLSLPLSVAYTQSLKGAESKIIWLDRAVLSNVLNANLQLRSQNDDPQLKKMQEISNEGWDLFVRILGDGSYITTVVANIDRRPPTLLQQYTLIHSEPRVLSLLPLHFYFLPNPDSTCLTLVTSPPLSTHDLSVAPFIDGKSDALRSRARGIEKISQDEAKIVRLVRTPSGNGVGVVRSEEGVQLKFFVGNLYATYSSQDTTLTLHSHPIVTLSIPPVNFLFSLPYDHSQEYIIAITTDFDIIRIRVTLIPHFSLMLQSRNSLPLPQLPLLLLPVDPMAWSGDQLREEHDVLLSVSDEGRLEFWVPEEGTSLGWRSSGSVKTGRRKVRMARCSSAKKTALVVRQPDGEELTIWDSKESEFASGLEYRRMLSLSERINDLDWTSTPDKQSILAVGFTTYVEFLCQQRMTYFDDEPGWVVCWKISIEQFVPYPISDSIWLANGSFLVGAGHQLFLFGQPKSSDGREATEGLFEHVARHNGPLDDYHPQMLLQCLLWGKVELVKEVIVNLARSLQVARESGLQAAQWQSIPTEQYLRPNPARNSGKRSAKLYNSLFDNIREQPPQDGEFSRPLVMSLIENLEAQPLPHLTPNEHAHLLVLIQTTLEVDEQHRALDANGLRYVMSMRSFYILNHRASSDPNSPQSKGSIPRHVGWRERLRYRDMIWAFHSESQEILLDISTTACKGKMRWSDARALGVFLWLNSTETIKSQIEVIARNEYMADGKRDPTTCSLFYFALGKVKLVQGLWRQAAWHKEQAMMLKFLNNDFTQPRWRTAALKNAYALLGKQRFEYAAAFFLLGNSLKDAVNVCIKQLSDFQLAIALARAVEQDQEKPVLCDILRNTVIPTAFGKGNRWLGSWAFWLLHRRDLAVRILLTPLTDIADSLDIRVQEIGEPHYDDPSLALLFSQLKSKTLQAAKGTSEISGQSEFNFVLQMARVFCRMGCHSLALDLVQSWSFERPSTYLHEAPEQKPDHSAVPSSSSTSRHSAFALEPAFRRQSSIMIDMDVSSLPSTRKASPSPGVRSGSPQEPTKKEDVGSFERKAGLGKLMKSAKHDVQVPEFNMDAFF